MEDGDAPVHLGQDRLTDGLVLVGDDHDLGLPGAQGQHFVQRDGNGDQQQHAVEQILRLVEHHLGGHDGEIKDPQGHGHGDAEELFQHQRGDIHAAGGGACTDDDAQAAAEADARENGIEHQIVGDVDIAQGLVQNFKENGIEQGTQEGGHGEFPAQDQPAHGQHHHVEHENEAGQRDMQKMLHHQTDARGAAADELGGQQEKLDGEGVDDIAQQYQQQAGDLAAIKFQVFHNEHPPIKNTPVRDFP